MVAETCKLTKSRMLWFARASVGLAGFSAKILVALKNYFSLYFFLILGTCIPVPGLCLLHIFGDPCQVSKMFLKKLEFVDWIIALNLPTCM